MNGFDARPAGRDAVVVATARTPIGRAVKGSLASVRPDDLAAGVIAAALAKVPDLDPATLDDLYLGCAEPRDEHGGNLARRVAVQLGLDTVPAATVNRFCASSVQTARMAAHAIWAGEGDAYVSAGVECVSRYRGFGSAGVDPADTQNPLFASAGARTQRTAETNQTWHDPRDDGELPDVYISMGQTAENVATECGISRADQDQFALWSQQKTAASQERCRFQREIVPIAVAGASRGEPGRLFAQDEFPRPDSTLEALGKLKPAFRTDGKGSVTAGNSSGINDGACALLLASERAVSELGFTPLARIVASAVAGVEPRTMGLGPVPATRKILAKTKLSLPDLDVIELNEAFAAQVLACTRRLGLDDRDPRVNPNGGAIALGHPLGMSGSRLLLTAAHELKETGKQYALCTMCVGVGQGMATIIARV